MEFSAERFMKQNGPSYANITLYIILGTMISSSHISKGGQTDYFRYFQRCAKSEELEFGDYSTDMSVTEFDCFCTRVRKSLRDRR